MRNRLARVALGLAAIAPLILVSAGSSPHSYRAGGVDYLTNRDANYRASLVSDGLLTRFANDRSFGSSWITPAGVTVSLVGSRSAALRSALRIGAHNVPIRIVETHNSAARLLQTTATIGAAEASLASQGVDVSAWGPDDVLGKVKISLRHYSAKSAEALVSRYGGEYVYVSKQSLQPQPLDRESDTPPFDGADYVTRNYAGGYEFCTS